LLAVDLYNRSGNERQLEAFIVHMSLAWLRLMQAKIEKDGGNLFIKNRRGQRLRHEDGGWKYKPLNSLTEELFAENDPRRVNLTFLTGLRNIIEHRYERDIAGLVAGRTQAHVLNYERTLTEWFGSAEGVGQQLRFPIFISSITQDAVAALKETRKRIPKGVLEWVQDFDTTLEPEMAADQQFDFRIYLVPHTGPKTEADAAMTFVKMEALDDSQRDEVEHVQTIIREKQVPVAGLDTLRPTQVAERVQAAIGKPFTVNNHTSCWRHYKVRPSKEAERPEVTKSDFCVYNKTFAQYAYTQEWVKYLIRKMSDDATYDFVLAGRAEFADDDE
jgi:hypothetical protein